MANKHQNLSKSGTGLMMNMVRNDSVSNLYIMPSAEKSEKSVVVNLPNYPLKHFELRNDDFLKLVLNKEIHARRSTEGSPCTDLDEVNYYEVMLTISLFQIGNCIQLFPFFAVHW